MSDVVEPLILDLLEWVSHGEKTYEQVMDAWRTSCPRLAIWEEVTDRRLVEREQANGRSVVKITSAGRVFLEQHRPAAITQLIANH